MITAVHIVFLLIAAVTLASAMLVVSAKRIMHAAMWLVLTLLGVAILFALLEARFFVVVQVIVYIGAIAILIIFVVMLTRNIMQDKGPQVNKTWWVSAIIAFLFFASILVTMSGWDNFMAQTRTVPEGGEDLIALGKSFVDPSAYLIPFEVASVLLLAALIGAVFLARERKGGQE